MFILVSPVLAAGLVSCEEKKALVVLEPRGSGAQIRMEPIAQLVANRTTHVAVDALGNLYWSQESDDGQDLLFVTRPDGNLPQPSALSSASILAALKPLTPESTGKSSNPRATNKPGGNIQSLVAGHDGALYFYFNGGFGPTGAQALGRFEPRSGEIQIVADTQQLASISEMGRSLDLARGQLLVCGRMIRLFLRHTDTWAILDFEPNRLPAFGQGQLARTIRLVRVTEPVDLTTPEIDLAAGPAIDRRAALLMIDRKFGAMYIVDDSGNARLLASLVGLSQELSQPTIEPAKKNPDKPEQVLIFAADGARIDPSITAHPQPPVNLLVQYPALLMLDTASGEFSAISKDDIHAPGAFAIYATKMQQLSPIGKDSFVGYDASSGQLMRVNVSR